MQTVYLMQTVFSSQFYADGVVNGTVYLMITVYSIRTGYLIRTV